MKIPQINDSTKEKLVKVGIGILGFYVAKNLLIEILKNSRKKGTEDKIDNDPNAAQAFAIKMALNPSGFRSFFYVDGVDEPELFKQAKLITDFDKVAAHYKALTGGKSVYDDIDTKLSAKNAEKFLGIASKGKNGNKNYADKREDIPLNYWVITSKETNVRTSPKWQHWALPGDNIKATVAAGKIIGKATGKFVYDEFKDIVFLEIFTYNQKMQKKIYYVAKSQVELLNDAEKEKRQKAENLKVEILLDGVNEKPVPTQEIISISNAVIMNDKFQTTGRAAKGFILGFPVMTLNTGQGKLIQFTTVQGQVRWVKAEQVKIQDRKI